MSDQHDEPGKRGSRWWRVVAFAVLVAYPLSMGPAILLTIKVDPAGSQWIEYVLMVVYFPLLLFRDAFGWPELFEEYLDLWVPW